MYVALIRIEKLLFYFKPVSRYKVRHISDFFSFGQILITVPNRNFRWKMEGVSLPSPLIQLPRFLHNTICSLLTSYCRQLKVFWVSVFFRNLLMFLNLSFRQDSKIINLIRGRVTSKLVVMLRMHQICYHPEYSLNR